MDDYERLRDTFLGMIIRDIPEQFWVDLRALSMITYSEAFASAFADKALLPQQKIDYLLQRRHLMMEKLLVETAGKHGISYSTTAIPENGRHHAYVFAGDVGMTQSYVQAIGSLPQPAKYRKQLANAMDLPRLDLGDEPKGALNVPHLYGVLAHNPVGKKFTLEAQKLGNIQFCVPARDCRGWAAEITIAEIFDAYPAIKEETRPKRTLPRKKSGGKGDQASG